MEWNEKEKDYPIINIQSDYEDGLSMWLLKILDLAFEFEGKWDVIIADLWPGDSDVRLIGHVQHGDDPIGMDTGFRVCAKISGREIKGESQHPIDFNFLESVLLKVVKSGPIADKLTAANDVNPLTVHFTAYGEGPVQSTLPIWPFTL